MSHNNIDNAPSQRQKDKHMKIFLDELLLFSWFPQQAQFRSLFVCSKCLPLRSIIVNVDQSEASIRALLANQRPVLPVRSNCECCYKCKMIRKRSQLISTDTGWLFIMNWMNLRGREARGIAIQRVVWRHHLNLELINWRLASDWLLAAAVICNFELLLYCWDYERV